MRVVDHNPGVYHYALGDASRAYATSKLRTFTRELLYVPANNVLFIFDRVDSTDPSFHKAWLLHGVNEPSVDQDAGSSTHDFANAKTFRFVEGAGELLVHSLLPEKRTITRRGGSGDEFYTPGNDAGGAWGTGKNWPMENPAGEPLPDDPKYRRMWKLFWGEDFDRILPSNRKNVVPGAWRIEVSPSESSQQDFFLHVLEIGDKGSTGKNRVELLNGTSVKGAVFEHGPAVLFGTSSSGVHEAEVSMSDVACTSLIIAGLQPNAVYELSLTGLNITNLTSRVLPGVSAGVFRLRANRKGIIRSERSDLRNLRLRIAKIKGAEEWRGEN
jgi:heparin/heparan-sulfate lyase